MNTPVPTEAQECAQLVAYLRIKGYKFTHIANETTRGNQAKWQGIRNKRMGTSSGFPDYLVITRKGLVAIEMKRLKGSIVSEKQKEWITALNACGVPARICKGYIEAIAFIDEVEK